MRRSALASIALATVGTVALAACSTDPAPASQSEGVVDVVATTDVYADIALQIGGDAISVTSIISGTAQDPHSYEATAHDQLSVVRADVIIENGGGYDPFMERLRNAADNDAAVVLNASSLSGLLPEDADEHSEEHAEDEHAEEEHAEEEHAEEEHSGAGAHEHIEGFNEHVWYSFPAVRELAHELAHVLGEIDPANADTFERNYDDFAAAVSELESAAAALAEDHGGTPTAVTEPVPVHLLEAAGLVDVTPHEFSEAIEEGSDVPPRALNEILELVSGGEAALLVNNEQTSSSETELVAAAAEAAGIPVVAFTETLPDGADYQSWMSENLAAVAEALG